MKIIQANKFYHLRGGTERYVFQLSAWLKEQGHEVIPFAMQHPENRESAFAKYFPSYVQTQRVEFGLGALKTFGRMLYSWEAARDMERLIEDERPDLCHAHNLYTQLSPSVLVALHRRGVPVVMTVHDHHLVSPAYNVWAHGAQRAQGDLRFHKNSFVASFAQTTAFRFHRARGYYRRSVQTFMVPCRYMQRQMVAAGFPSDRIIVNPFGIDPARIEPRYDHDGYLLFVGRLSEEKGVETVLTLARMLPDVRFKIAGTGPQEAALHALSHTTANVEFLGFQKGDALRELYRGAIAVLLPSHVHEVFPFVALEAMAAGKPVIASHVGGIPEMIEDRVNGMLVAPLDAFGWGEAVTRVVYDSALRERLGRAARLMIETKFSAARHYREVMEVYHRIAKR